MPSTEELDKYYHDIVFNAECGILQRYLNKPKVCTTASIASLRPDIIVPENIGSKLFSEDTSYKYRGLLLVFVAVLSGIRIVFMAGEENPVWQNLFMSAAIVAVAGLGWYFMLQPDPRVFIEIDATGINVEGYSYTWGQIQQTYIVKRSGKGETNKLVILLKNEQTARFEIECYSSQVEVCKYIEHFKTRYSHK